MGVLGSPGTGVGWGPTKSGNLMGGRKQGLCTESVHLAASSLLVEGFTGMRVKRRAQVVITSVMLRLEEVMKTLRKGLGKRIYWCKLGFGETSSNFWGLKAFIKNAEKNPGRARLCLLRCWGRNRGW